MRIADKNDILKNISIDPNGCWIWKKCLRNGYGAMTINGENNYAHRISYEVFKGIIGRKLEIDHLCSVRSCVNPNHLEAVTHTENLRRGSHPYVILFRNKTCKKGHKVEGENSLKNHRGGNRCKICFKDISKRYYIRKKMRDKNWIQENL